MKRILYILMLLVVAVCVATPQVNVPVPKSKPKVTTPKQSTKPSPKPSTKPSTRRCSQCGQTKSLDGFDGSSRICWSCVAANERAEEERQQQAAAERLRREQEERNRFADKTYTVNGVSFTMITVKGGTFTMGAIAEQGSDADSDEKPAHRVTLSDYYIGKTEVTEALWTAVMGTNPSCNKKGDNYPVENVSWKDCQAFISKLNALTGETFRLPTEAEWEFAARGGTMRRGYKYSGSNTIGDVAWYTVNAYDVGSSSSNYGKHPVATKAANELGIYDMSGNVWEWCQDWYGYSYYSSSPATNPTGPSRGSNRVFRGGSWIDYARICRVSIRYSSTPSNTYFNLGLRLAR